MLLQSAGFLLSRAAPPRFVFIDGRTFSMRYQIDRVEAYAGSQGCSVKLIELVCSDEVARKRLQHCHVAKNRNFNLYLKVKAAFEPIVRNHLTLNTDVGLNEADMQRCLQYLRGK
jgi:predicted kinase